MNMCFVIKVTSIQMPDVGRRNMYVSIVHFKLTTLSVKNDI